MIITARTPSQGFQGTIGTLGAILLASSGGATTLEESFDIDDCYQDYQAYQNRKATGINQFFGLR